MEKLSEKDILKLGGSLKAHNLKDDEATRKMIADVLEQQEQILKTAKVDWNNPILRTPMDV